MEHRYPTPPPTSSPKHQYHNEPQEYRNDSDIYGKVPLPTDTHLSNLPHSSDSAYGTVPAATDTSEASFPQNQKPPYQDEQHSSGYPSAPTKVPAQDSYHNTPLMVESTADSFQTATQEYYNGSGKHRPAQETYYQSTSDPVSPSHMNPSQYPYSETFNPMDPSRPNAPPRRSSSPIPNTDPLIDTYYTQPRPIRRRSSPTLGRIPSPLHYRPGSRPLSPYSASRPQPRPGLMRRLWRRIKSWVSSFISWARENPIKMGLMTFLPFLVGAGVWKTLKGLKHLYDHHISNKWRGKRDRRHIRDEWKKELKSDAKKAKESVKAWHEDIFGEFKRFGGSKAGPFDGILRIVHMMINHYCRLSPSNFPRAASILLELYFLDAKRL